jgi:hypothetical protein
MQGLAKAPRFLPLFSNLARSESRARHHVFSLQTPAKDEEGIAKGVGRGRKWALSLRATVNVATNDGELDEASLVKLYMDLTGTSEACARSVYMFISDEKEQDTQKSNGLERWRTPEVEPARAKPQLSPAIIKAEREFGMAFLGREPLAVTGK